MLLDLHNEIDVRAAITPVVITDDTPSVSAIIDLAGARGLEFVLSLGTLSDANATAVVLVEHGDVSNLSDAAAVADDDLLGTEALAGFQFNDDGETRKIGYKGSKRYVRLTVTPSGNTGNIPLCAIAIVHGVMKQPVA